MIGSNGPTPESAGTPTADSVRTVVELLTQHEVVWALWRRNDSSLEIHSDLDLVAVAPLPTVLPAMRTDLENAGYRLLLQVRYDIAGAHAVWLLDPDGKVFHLDVLADPVGIGRLAIPTTMVLQSVKKTERIPCVGPEWDLCYRIVKAVIKSSPETLETLGRRNLPSGLDAALATVLGKRATQVERALTGQWRAERWESMLRGLRRSLFFVRIRRRGPFVLIASIAHRAWQRFRRPVGLWIHFRVDSQLALQSLTGLGVRLVTDWPTSWIRRWQRAVSLRVSVLRPTVVVTWGRDRVPPFWARARAMDSPDLSKVIEALEAHAWSGLR